MPTTPSSLSDSWGEASTSNLPPFTRQKAPTQPIPDDWDAEESDDEISEQDNQAVWEAANTKSPLPELVITRSSTSQPLITPPPPTLRILKRPSLSPSSSSSSGSTAAAGEKTLEEREREYRVARERIFADGDGVKKGSSLGKSPSNPTTSTSNPPTPNPNPNSNPNPPKPTIIRNPRGPPSNPSNPTSPSNPNPNPNPRGFGRRKQNGA
ncbi:hypothetical protein JAAARDRAFT_41623 [Jaapia argillacea MUCL 33604]|uniref:SUZ domain-containing protein n=1 Tax=Jaapia argillacea MUCL 33604 TaxID=933084 RepID=A0A067P7Y5_9AGAM|nr:hypothetical protein JAAARDRAFT_41623 [Jaapia argillacea MUCL 33604]